MGEAESRRRDDRLEPGRRLSARAVSKGRTGKESMSGGAVGSVVEPSAGEMGMECERSSNAIQLEQSRCGGPFGAAVALPARPLFQSTPSRRSGMFLNCPQIVDDRIQFVFRIKLLHRMDWRKTRTIQFRAQQVI